MFVILGQNQRLLQTRKHLDEYCDRECGFRLIRRVLSINESLRSQRLFVEALAVFALPVQSLIMLLLE